LSLGPLVTLFQFGPPDAEVFHALATRFAGESGGRGVSDMGLERMPLPPDSPTSTAHVFNWVSSEGKTHVSPEGTGARRPVHFPGLVCLAST